MSSNKRRKSSNLRDPSYPPHHHSHHPHDQPSTHHHDLTTTSPTNHTLNNNNNQYDIEFDQDHDQEDPPRQLDDDHYTIQKRAELIGKDKLKILLERFDPLQMDRYIEYRNSTLAKSNIRKLANSILQQSVSDRVTIAIRGFAKVFVGHMVEQALQVQSKRGGSGPLTQYDLKEAYRAFLNERDRGGSNRRKMFIK